MSHSGKHIDERAWGVGELQRKHWYHPYINIFIYV